MIGEIRRKFRAFEYEYSLHAVDQSILRRIPRKEIEEAVAAGEIIEDYPTDKYGPSECACGTCREPTLGINSTKITDAGLALISAMEDLQLCRLDLSGSRISDDGLRYMQQIFLNNGYLNLSRTPIGDKGVENLEKCFIRDLSLANTKITNRTVALLVSHRKLQDLDLSSTRVSDSCVSDLAKLPELYSVNLTRTRVTPAGVAKLQALRPTLDIKYPQPPPPSDVPPSS